MQLKSRSVSSMKTMSYSNNQQFQYGKENLWRTESSKCMLWDLIRNVLVCLSMEIKLKLNNFSSSFFLKHTYCAMSSNVLCICEAKIYKLCLMPINVWLCQSKPRILQKVVSCLSAHCHKFTGKPANSYKFMPSTPPTQEN